MPENTRVYQKSLHSTTNFKKAPEITRRAIDLQKVPQITRNYKEVPESRPAQLAELPRSKFDPELFPHSAYVEIFVTFATKVPYLTFCNKM